MLISIFTIFNTSLLKIDVGPFAPLIGYVGAVMGAIYCLCLMVWGRKQIWSTPDDVLPKTISKIVAIMTAVSMVLFWLSASPDSITNLSVWTICLASTTLVGYLSYYFLLHRFTYLKQTTSHNEKILGGLWLTNQAKINKRQFNVTIQELFAGAAYDKNKLWNEISLSLSKMLLILLYLIIMISGSLAICNTALIVQVKLTNKPAAVVIKKEDSPGLNDIKR